MRGWVLALFLLLGGINAAHAAFFSDDEARKQISALQQQVTQLQARLDDALKQNQAVDGRVQALEKSQAVVDLLNQIERLNGEVNRLKGQIEVMSHDVEITQNRQRDLYADLDGRLRQLEGRPVAAAAPSAQPAQPTGAAGGSLSAPASPSVAAIPPPVAPTAAADQSDTDKAEYDAAYALVSTSKHSEIIKAFQEFLDRHPNSKYAPNALYWIGTAQFSLHDFKASLATQQKLIKRYPDHQKAPDAMYNMANSQLQLTEVDAAKQTLRLLIEKYPQSIAATRAKKILTAHESSTSKSKN